MNRTSSASSLSFISTAGSDSNGPIQRIDVPTFDPSHVASKNKRIQLEVETLRAKGKVGDKGLRLMGCKDGESSGAKAVGFGVWRTLNCRARMA